MENVENMDKMDIAGLFSELIRFETELWDAVDRRMREVHDLPLTRFEPMQVIARTPRCRVNNISEALSITVGGTSKLVDRIEAAGLCKRTQDPEDGRSSIIELTLEGEQQLAAATRTFVEELEKRIGSTVPKKSLQQFATTIRQLRQGLRTDNAS